MKVDSITDVEIDSQGRLLIYPSQNTYSMIYREGVEVHWDSNGKYLYSPKPRNWNYLEWFKHIITTVKDLQLTSDTRWVNIPEDLRKDAESWMDDI